MTTPSALLSRFSSGEIEYCTEYRPESCFCNIQSLPDLTARLVRNACATGASTTSLLGSSNRLNTLSSGNPRRQVTAEIVQSQWADLGIEVTIRSIALLDLIDELPDEEKKEAPKSAYAHRINSFPRPDSYFTGRADSLEEFKGKLFQAI